MKLNKPAFSTVKPRHTLTALALASSLCMLAPQAYAVGESGIDFGNGGFLKSVNSTGSAVTELASVTATCPQNGFLYAMGSATFQAQALNTPKVAHIRYSVARDVLSLDISAEQDLVFRVNGAVNGSSILEQVGASPVVRLDSCTAGQSITYRFVANRGASNAAEGISAFQPRISVIFFQNKI